MPLAGYEGDKGTVVGNQFCLEGENARNRKGSSRNSYKQAEIATCRFPAFPTGKNSARGADLCARQDWGALHVSDGWDRVWSKPGPARGPFTACFDGWFTITYSWYKFVDQPALQNLGLSAAQKARLQAFVERLHARWRITGDYMPPPSTGILASLDQALVVAPPRGMAVGYVPIVTRQERK